MKTALPFTLPTTSSFPFSKINLHLAFLSHYNFWSKLSTLFKNFPLFPSRLDWCLLSIFHLFHNHNSFKHTRPLVWKSRMTILTPFLLLSLLLWYQVPYVQIRENNWTLNADLAGRWNVKFTYWVAVEMRYPSCRKLTVNCERYI